MDKIPAAEMADRLKAVQQRIEARTAELPPLIDPADDPETPVEALHLFRELTAQIVQRTHEMEVPKTEDFGLGEILGDKKAGIAKKHIITLNEFLRMRAIVDKFRDDHTSRRAWKELMKTQSPALLEQYGRWVGSQNQLNGNNLMAARLATEVCGHLLLPVDKGLGDKITALFREAPDFYAYGRMPLPEKIKVVRLYESNAATTLNTLCLKPGETETIKVT